MPAKPIRSAPPDNDAPTLQVLEHRALERWLARAMSVAHGLGLTLTRLDLESVLDEARRKTGLRDWGEERFFEPMRKMLSSVEQCEYSSLARVMFHGNAERAVIHRLYTEAFFARHPEAEAIPVHRPVFVLGFPRTGTTSLQNLLALHPARRALQFWELVNPAPIDPDPERDRRRRIALVERDLRWSRRMAPEMVQMHDARATSHEECWPLLANSATVLNNDVCHGLKPFGEWLLEQDLTWAYREYRRQLQMLLHRKAAHRLVLKCPEHLWFLDALLEVFPDACIVWTHREPTTCIASYASMISLSRRFLQGRIDPPAVGAHVADRFLTGVTRAMAVRDRVGDDRFIDVPLAQLSADPVATVRAVERRFDLDPADDDELRQWLEVKRADDPGRHRYSEAMFGLRRDEVATRFSEYVGRFDLAPP